MRRITLTVACPEADRSDANNGIQITSGAADFTFNGFIKEFRVWADDIGDTGIAEAST